MNTEQSTHNQLVFKKNQKSNGIVNIFLFHIIITFEICYLIFFTQEINHFLLFLLELTTYNDPNSFQTQVMTLSNSTPHLDSQDRTQQSFNRSSKYIKFQLSPDFFIYSIYNIHICFGKISDIQIYVRRFDPW